MSKKDWFEDWFDSPYYHLLYKHRDEQEAGQFITKLVAFLDPPKNASFLDLACGRGRHSVFLNKLGFDVTGVDLSPANIAFAQSFTTESLRFAVHDMRQVYKPQFYDAVVNLFTSFGYFDTIAQNQQVITAMAKMVKPKGVVVLDYLNGHLVTSSEPERVEEEGVIFTSQKSLVKDKVIKKIAVKDKEQTHHFKEEVRIFSIADFEAFFKHARLTISAIFGDYALQPFDINTSARMIFIAHPNP